MAKSKKTQPKYKGSQCITWLDTNGERHRSRFFKGTSTLIIDRELEAKQQNVKCYEVSVMDKTTWVKKFGEVDFPRKQPAGRFDISMTDYSREMKAWKQDNRHLYYNSVF